MLWRGDREPGLLPEPLPLDEGKRVTRDEGSTDPFLEANGPLLGRPIWLAPAVGGEVVNQVAAPQNQDAFLAEGGEPTPQFEMEGSGFAPIDGQLDDGNVGLGKESTED